MSQLMLQVSPLAMNVIKAEAEADKLSPLYKDAKKAYETARDALNVENHKVFEARTNYVVDLLKRAILHKKNSGLLICFFTGNMPFTIDLDPQRLSFGLTIHATATESEKKISSFKNVEDFLLKLL